MRKLPYGFLLFLSACSVFDPSLVEDFDAGATPDVQTPDAPMTPDVLGDVRPDVPIVENGCDGAGFTLPGPPGGADTDGPEVMLGLHNLLLNQDGERWRMIGRNLDGLCTTSSNLENIECQPRTEGDSPVIDGEGGIDNAFGGPFFATVDLVAPDLDSIATDSNALGTGVVLTRIRGWNGEMNDPRVELVLMQSVYGFAGTPEQSEPPAHDVVSFDPFMPGTTDRMPPPTWDGNDWMFPRTDNFYDDDLENPRVITVNAYVSSGVLVASIEDNVPFNFASAVRGITVKLTDGMVVLQLHPSVANYGQAILSGRWKVQELLQAARTVEICAGTPQFSILSNALDKVADVLAMPGASNETPCDALSVAVRWTFSTVRLRPPVAGALPPDRCAGM